MFDVRLKIGFRMCGEVYLSKAEGGRRKDELIASFASNASMVVCLAPVIYKP